MEHPPKQGLKQRVDAKLEQIKNGVLMEHPPKQGLKLEKVMNKLISYYWVLMEHPPKQGLKRPSRNKLRAEPRRFNGTSTKTRIETKKKVQNKD